MLQETGYGGGERGVAWRGGREYSISWYDIDRSRPIIINNHLRHHQTQEDLSPWRNPPARRPRPFFSPDHTVPSTSFKE